MNTQKTRKNTKENRKVVTNQEKNIQENCGSELIERSKYSLDLINYWIKSADSKISISGGIISIVVAVLVFVAENLLSKVDTTNGYTESWRFCFIVTSAVAVISFLYSLFCHFNALSPNFFSGDTSGGQSKRKKCCIFFEDIKDYKNAEEYKHVMKKITEKQFVDDILQEVYSNSHICSKKMHEFKKGLWSAFLSIAMIMGSVICYVKMYHQ